MAKQHRGQSRAVPAWIPTALVAALLVMMVLVAPSIGPWEFEPRDITIGEWEQGTAEPVEQPAVAPNATPAPIDGEGRTISPLWGQGLLAAVILAAVILAAWILIAVLRQRRRRTPDAAETLGDVTEAPPEADLPALQESVRLARDDLAAAADPTDAIVRAWLRLEHAASASGVAREPSDTPTDVTVNVLRTTGADRAATRTLLRLYHRARFGSVPMTTADQDRAARALADLARTWEQIRA